MPLSEEAQASKPKQPNNAYFQFRSDKMQDFKGEEKRIKKVN